MFGWKEKVSFDLFLSSFVNGSYYYNWLDFFHNLIIASLLLFPHVRSFIRWKKRFHCHCRGLIHETYCYVRISNHLNRAHTHKKSTYIVFRGKHSLSFSLRLLVYTRKKNFVVFLSLSCENALPFSQTMDFQLY